MQRKATSNTRGANAEEKRFMAFVKRMPCCVCGMPGPSIVDHAYGATFKHNKILIGHWFLLPLCERCDEVDTLGSRRSFRNSFGPKSEYWLRLIINSPVAPSDEVVAAIKDWAK